MANFIARARARRCRKPRGWPIGKARVHLWFDRCSSDGSASPPPLWRTEPKPYFLRPEQVSLLAVFFDYAAFDFSIRDIAK